MFSEPLARLARAARAGHGRAARRRGRGRRRGRQGAGAAPRLAGEGRRGRAIAGMKIYLDGSRRRSPRSPSRSAPAVARAQFRLVLPSRRRPRGRVRAAAGHRRHAEAAERAQAGRGRRRDQRPLSGPGLQPGGRGTALAKPALPINRPSHTRDLASTGATARHALAPVTGLRAGLSPRGGRTGKRSMQSHGTAQCHYAPAARRLACISVTRPTAGTRRWRRSSTAPATTSTSSI